jgi:putative toxin-antitoxin system antitoxin component (TIGR02293 family)
MGIGLIGINRTAKRRKQAKFLADKHSFRHRHIVKKVGQTKMASIPANLEPSVGQPPLRWISISARAGEVFANQEKAVHWLQTPNPSLAGRTPLEAAKSDAGYQEAEDILTRIEHGVLG